MSKPQRENLKTYSDGELEALDGVVQRELQARGRRVPWGSSNHQQALAFLARKNLGPNEGDVHYRSHMQHIVVAARLSDGGILFHHCVKSLRGVNASVLGPDDSDYGIFAGDVDEFRQKLALTARENLGPNDGDVDFACIENDLVIASRMGDRVLFEHCVVVASLCVAS